MVHKYFVFAFEFTAEPSRLCRRGHHTTGAPDGELFDVPQQGDTRCR